LNQKVLFKRRYDNGFSLFPNTNKRDNFVFKRTKKWRFGVFETRGLTRSRYTHTHTQYVLSISLSRRETLQFADVANPYPSRRVRFFVRQGTVSVRGTRRRPEIRPSQVQFFHVRVRSGHGAIGRAGAVHAAHSADLFAGLGRPANRRKRHRDRLGTVERRRHFALGPTRGNHNTHCFRSGCLSFRRLPCLKPILGSC